MQIVVDDSIQGGQQPLLCSATQQRDGDGDRTRPRKGSKKITPKRIYSKPFESTFPFTSPFPPNRFGSVFRKQYEDRLSDELARLFYHHRPRGRF